MLSIVTRIYGPTPMIFWPLAYSRSTFWILLVKLPFCVLVIGAIFFPTTQLLQDLCVFHTYIFVAAWIFVSPVFCCLNPKIQLFPTSNILPRNLYGQIPPFTKFHEAQSPIFFGLEALEIINLSTVLLLQVCCAMMQRMVCFMDPKIPSGKRLHSYRKSPFIIGKSTINDHFQ